MKHIKLMYSFIIISVCVFTLPAEELVITKVSPSPITIGGVKHTAGKSFPDQATIRWSSENQAMVVVPKNGGSPRSYSAKKCSSKSMSAMQYNKTYGLSTLGGDNNFTVGKNKKDFDEKRIALVIGNSAYEFIRPNDPLTSPLYDAIDVTDKLVELGFDVCTSFDLTSSEFTGALKEFKGKAIGYDVALIYYSGHGKSYNGKDYLIPIDKTDLPKDIYECIDVEDEIYTTLLSTRCPTKLLFINACRDEQLDTTTEEEFNGRETRGLYVSFAAAPGKFAYESKDFRNSPYAEAFMQSIGKPSPNFGATTNNIGISIKDISKRMGLPAQEPQGYGTQSIEFTFVKPNGELFVTDIDELEALAAKGDSRAYIKIAQYYMRHSAGYTSYEKAHIYAVKALESNVEVESAKQIIEWLDDLEFYKYNESNLQKPSY